MARPQLARIVDRPQRELTGSLELVTGKNALGVMLKRLPYGGPEEKERARTRLQALATELRVVVVEV